MDIFEFAMKMEKDGEEYYRDLASKTKIEGLKKILGLMADDEVDHYNVLKKLKESTATTLVGTTVIAGAKNLFARMKEEGAKFDLEGTEIDLYKQAIDIEKKSEAFYKEKAAGVEGAAKDQLLKIAVEEQKHVILLGHMVEFLSRPQSWVENAEFNQLSEY